MQKKSRFKGIIEFALVLYFTLGGLENVEYLKYADYIISLSIQVLIYLYILMNKNIKIRSKVLATYFVNFSLISMILVNFIVLDIQLLDILNRILPLISIFGFIIVFGINSDRYMDFNEVIKKTIYGYAIIGSVVLFDALSFLVFNISLWPPESYLGLRFSGPFFDSNFLGLFFGSFLIVLLYYNNSSIKYKSIIILIFLANLILSLSWTNIALFLVSLILWYFIKFKDLFIKQILVLVLYFIFIYIYINNFRDYQILFLNFFSSFLPFTEPELLAKFLSFDYRLKAQFQAIEVFKENIMGMGPRTLVPVIGMDTHNSYIGILFELGVPGFLLLLINVRFKLEQYSKMLSALSTFVFLMSLTLNVHYTVIYTLLLALIINKHYLDKN
jgi:hypothetical protein